MAGSEKQRTKSNQGTKAFWTSLMDKAKQDFDRDLSAASKKRLPPMGAPKHIEDTRAKKTVNEASYRDRLNFELGETDAKLRRKAKGSGALPSNISKEEMYRYRKSLTQAENRIKTRKKGAAKKKKERRLKPGEHTLEKRGVGQLPRRKIQHI